MKRKMDDSELTLEQWKAKFKNANMDKAEAIFRERKAQADIAALLDIAEQLCWSLINEFDIADAALASLGKTRGEGE